MKEPILVIMAAGMGSRYGGLKQIDPITQQGEIIIDFSIFDAIRAGFKRAVLIIKGEHEQDFRDVIGNRIADFIEVQYAHQELTTLPQGYTVPEGRTKPWGTTHAIWCCKDRVDAPFVVLNADDYYGPEAFVHMYRHLCQVQENGMDEYAMVGYILDNTLTDHGHVTRGVCKMEGEYLSEIVERKQIERQEGVVRYMDKGTWVDVDPNSLVSMNMWALTPAVFAQLEEDIVDFLAHEVPLDVEKSECLIPTTIGELIEKQKAKVKVYASHDTWQGVTYKEDKPQVMAALAKLKEEGKYPERLWK
ncbi:nucleotidyltransferase family protein [Niameybacter massiliensis]|uniref:nucleotidyltransferase family protein n=1 Tax=Niameybacter massiliensis TaxID=1658108 RepID=UPI0006B53682|nr:sugar phosphate nucleotidyltransferase [Niameybacter massiliensis]